MVYMVYIYKLIHSHIVDKINNVPISDSKTIRYYSTKKKAEEKIKEYQNKKGFENYPNNFKIEKLKIYAPSKSSKFYELWHEYMDKNGYDVITPIGVYGTFEEALAMKTKSLFYSKYKEHPNGFEIAEIKLDLDGWTEGFIPN